MFDPLRCMGAEKVLVHGGPRAACISNAACSPGVAGPLLPLRKLLVVCLLNDAAVHLALQTEFM